MEISFESVTEVYRKRKCKEKSNANIFLKLNEENIFGRRISEIVHNMHLTSFYKKSKLSMSTCSTMAIQRVIDPVSKVIVVNFTVHCGNGTQFMGRASLGFGPHTNHKENCQVKSPKVQK